MASLPLIYPEDNVLRCNDMYLDVRYRPAILACSFIALLLKEYSVGPDECAL